MQTNWFIVIRSRDAWWVDNEGHSFGPFDDREEAAKHAIEYARQFRDQKRVSQIYWPNSDGKQTMLLQL